MKELSESKNIQIFRKRLQDAHQTRLSVFSGFSAGPRRLRFIELLLFFRYGSGLEGSTICEQQQAQPDLLASLRVQLRGMPAHGCVSEHGKDFHAAQSDASDGMRQSPTTMATVMT